MENIKQLFFFPDLEPITDKTRAFRIREASLLPALPLVIILEKKDNDSLSSVTSDNDALSLRQSIRIRHTPNKFEVVAYYLALFAVAQSQIYELLSYNQAIESPEANL